MESNEENNWFHFTLAENALVDQNGTTDMPDGNRLQDQENPLSSDQENRYGEAGLLCGILMIFVAVIGLASNVTTVRIFTHRPLVSSINTLLAGLALADGALLISGVPLYSSVAVYSYWTGISDGAPTGTLERVVAYMTVYVYPFTSIFQTASVWTMVL